VTRLRQWIARAVLTITAVAVSVAGVVAQQADKEFLPLPPGTTLQEQLPATPLVFTAYGFVWVALLGYVLVLFSRLKKVERELADLRSKGRPAR
jgi:CcmD family protein